MIRNKAIKCKTIQGYLRSIRSSLYKHLLKRSSCSHLLLELFGLFVTCLLGSRDRLLCDLDITQGKILFYDQISTSG